MLFKDEKDARNYVQENKIQHLKTYALFDMLGFVGYSTEWSPFTRFIANFNYIPNYITS